MELSFFGKDRDSDLDRLCNFFNSTQLSSGKADLKTNLLIACDFTVIMTSFPNSEK